MVNQEQAKGSQEQEKTTQDQNKTTKKQAKTSLFPLSQIPHSEQNGGSTAVGPHSPQPKSMSVMQIRPQEANISNCKTISMEPLAWTPKLEKKSPLPFDTGW